MKFYALLAVAAVGLCACSSSHPKIDPDRRHVRYFYPTEMVAYTVNPPIGSWTYFEPKYEGTNRIFFQKKYETVVKVEVSFDLSELFVKFNDADAIEANKHFFRTGKFSEDATQDTVVTIAIGPQGVLCAKNMSARQQHYGPSTDPNISGKWAGQGNARFSYQIICPFHMDGRHFWFVMDKSYVVADAATTNGHEVDLKAINSEIDRQFEPVWKSIVFNRALSQTVLP